MQRLEFRAMGSHMLAILDSDTSEAADILSLVPHWFADWEQRLSRFRADSELTQLNRSPERRVPVSTPVWEVLQLARWAEHASAGLVTPMLLEALETAGYDRSFDVRADACTPLHPPVTRQSPAALTDRRALTVDWHAIDMDPHARSVRLPAGKRLDLGGIAKGWAAHRAIQLLAAYGPVLVDAGGDVAVSGPLSDGSPWPIGVADPAALDRQIDLLMLSAGAVATSGRDYRRWQQNGVWKHHILDPRTGRPAETEVLSATVIAPTTYEAEMAAKVTLILGGRDGLAWLDKRPAYAGLLVLEDGQVLYSLRMQDYRWECGEYI